MDEREKELQSVNKTFQGELRKLKEMTFQEKAQYIWDYYKIPIIFSVIIIATAISLVHHYATLKSTVLFGVVINADCPAISADTFTEEINEYLQLGTKETAFLETGLFLNSTATYETETKLTCYIVAHDLDWFVGDRDAMEYFGKQGLVSNLESLLPAELYAYFADRIVTLDYTNENTGETYQQSYLSIQDTALTELLMLEPKKGETLFIGSCIVAPHEERVLQLFQYIYDLETKP